MTNTISTECRQPNIFETYESEARSYCRNFDKVFTRASGCELYDADGNVYLDFLSCAGALNYGHNPEVIKSAVLQFIERDGVQGALDFHTDAKRDFIEAFERIIMRPRNMHYKVQFTSPTGTTVVESAIKLARKVTKRKNIVTFTNGFHGMTATSLGLTGNKHHRQAILDTHIDRIPFDKYFKDLNSMDLLEALWDDQSSGYEIPAAVIVETIQGEGGIQLASSSWMLKLRTITKKFGVLLIIDDIQAGCGRTGHFFSFESMSITPDLICLSKSLSGYGYPLSILLIEPSLDCWTPGEDNGTFRGNTLAMVSAQAALETYWQDTYLVTNIQNRNHQIMEVLNRLYVRFPLYIKDIRGKGLMVGIEFSNPMLAEKIARKCFKRKLILERCGNQDQVIKLFPPLTINEVDISRGLKIFSDTLCDVLTAIPASTKE